MASLTGHPRGAYLLVFTEFLERFSYYGMVSLLVLFMTASATVGGFGWTEPAAIAFFGGFTSLIWLSPLAGGWIADRYLGRRRSVLIGGLLMAAGHFGLFVAALTPTLALTWSGAHAGAFLDHLTTPLGSWPDAPRLAQAHALAVTSGATDLRGLDTAFLVSAISFLGGLGAVIVGNGLLKPSITVMLGDLYPKTDRRREEVFTLFYVAVAGGATAAAISAGTVGENIGWRYGFLICGSVMLVGILLYAALASSFLGQTGLKATTHATAEADASPAPTKVARPLTFIVLLSLFATVFWIGYQQSGGLLTVFAADHIDRNLGGFVVPASWVPSITPAFTILFGFGVASVLSLIERRGLVLDPPRRFAIGFGLGTAAFLVLAVAALAASASGARLAFGWYLAFFFFLTAAELALSPAGFAMVTRYAPSRTGSRMMGVWLLSVAAGSYLSGQIGAIGATRPIHEVLLAIAACFVASGALLLLFRRPLMRLVSESPLEAQSRNEAAAEVAP